MSSQFTVEKTIVLGYGAYEKIGGSFLNKIIRFETLLTAMQYFSWAKIGKPYMGIGRNLAYKREEFFKVRGFMDHMKIRSGDDDLFVNQAAEKKNTTICFLPDSFTYSKPKTSFKEWFAQKRRHVSTAKHYKLFDRNQLGLFYVSQLLFLLLSIILLAFQFQWIAVVSIIGFRYIFAPEGLNKFYAKGFGGKPAATWMTSEMREQEIADYISYLDLLYQTLGLERGSHKIMLLGFSQGVATATRWLHHTSHRIDELIVYAGEVAAELRNPVAPKLLSIPITYVTGNNDRLISPEKLADVRLFMQQLNAREIVFDGGHEVKAEVLKTLLLN
jgi:predicted esterase